MLMTLCGKEQLVSVIIFPYFKVFLKDIMKTDNKTFIYTRILKN